MRKQFTFYRSYYEALMQLSAKDRETMLLTIVRYALDGVEPTRLNAVQRAVFTLVRPTLDTSKKRAMARQNENFVKTSGQNKKENEGETEGETEAERETECETELKKELEKDSYTPPSGGPVWAGFEKFWNLYPVKLGKEKAWSVWNRRRPSPEAACKALEGWLACDRWTRDNGRFIPKPERFLEEQYDLHPPGDLSYTGRFALAELEAIAGMLEEGA